MRAAIVIGHDKTSPGAYSNYLHTSEYIYNCEVATYLAAYADIYKRPIGGNYKAQMRKLAAQINAEQYDLVIELHFNSFNKEVNGCETFSFPGNHKTLAFGDRYCEQLCKKYHTKNRGSKEAEIGGRGWWFLALMEAPAIILEPFFGDHEESLKFENPGDYAEVIRDLICN
jgi:N-acetylmuramoyl-L-alanine amidase